MNEPRPRRFLHLLTARAAGALFGVGLLRAGMANPAKVLAFLDLAGAWDPSLAFVMVGGIAVALVAFQAARGRTTSLLGAVIQLPVLRAITPRLVLGSAAVGVGWGLAGFCPAPAIVAVGAGEPKAFAFVGAMLAGMALYEILDRRPVAVPSPVPRRAPAAIALTGATDV